MKNKRSKQLQPSGSDTASILPTEPNGTSFVIEEIGTMDTIGRLYWRNRRQSGSKAILGSKTGSRNASAWKPSPSSG